MTPLQILQVAVGALLCAVGLVLTVRGRRRLSRKEGASEGAWVRLGVGIALVGVGYHVAGWALPATWAPLKAPVDLWWLVTAVAGVVALGAWRLEADHKAAGGRT